MTSWRCANFRPTTQDEQCSNYVSPSCLCAHRKPGTLCTKPGNFRLALRHSSACFVSFVQRCMGDRAHLHVSMMSLRSPNPCAGCAEVERSTRMRALSLSSTSCWNVCKRATWVKANRMQGSVRSEILCTCAYTNMYVDQHIWRLANCGGIYQLKKRTWGRVEMLPGRD